MQMSEPEHEPQLPAHPSPPHVFPPHFGMHDPPVEGGVVVPPASDSFAGGDTPGSVSASVPASPGGDDDAAEQPLARSTKDNGSIHLGRHVRAKGAAWSTPD
jgi:hypothetical protein